MNHPEFSRPLSDQNFLLYVHSIPVLKYSIYVRMRKRFLFFHMENDSQGCIGVL